MRLSSSIFLFATGVFAEGVVVYPFIPSLYKYPKLGDLFSEEGREKYKKIFRRTLSRASTMYYFWRYLSGYNLEKIVQRSGRAKRRTRIVRKDERVKGRSRIVWKVRRAKGRIRIV